MVKHGKITIVFPCVSLAGAGRTNQARSGNIDFTDSTEVYTSTRMMYLKIGQFPVSFLLLDQVGK